MQASDMVMSDDGSGTAATLLEATVKLLKVAANSSTESALSPLIPKGALTWKVPKFNAFPGSRLWQSTGNRQLIVEPPELKSNVLDYSH